MLNTFIKTLKGNTIPSAKPVEGKIYYEFKCGIRAHQEELSLSQDERLTEVLLSINLSDIAAMTVHDLTDMLLKGKLVSKVLGIILIGDAGNDYSGIKNSELEVVLKDFFSLNPTVISWLTTIEKGLTLLPQTQSTLNSKQT